MAADSAEITKELNNARIEGYKEFDLDSLYEYNLKIFGDVFEAIIGAVFLDSRSLGRTWEVLWHLI